MTPPILRKMNWWCELPKLDLTTALQIKGASGELLQLKGQGFSWKKPSSATSIFSLTAAPAGKGGFNVTDATNTSIQLNRPSTSRGWISWKVGWLPGSRVVFNWSTSPSVRMYSGLDDVIGLSSLNYTMSNSSGFGSVNYVIPAGGGWSYFGFTISSGQPAGILTISNFAVYAP